ncbi:MAG: sugar transferase [Micrococcus sp.]|nr:sugar transferase [Micrococcus sp.]
MKRAIDVAAAATGLIVTAPLMAATAVAVAKNLGRPVLFTQQRPGKDGRVFTLYKFRSMKDESLFDGPATDEERLTGFGRALRSTSLDELPSLVNVLKGDMSLVGPRPLLVDYLALYTARQARRHDVRPGITGLAQVSGRNAVGWDDRFELDVQYVDNLSLTQDLRILWRTVRAVLVRDGISAEGEATMSRFTGSERATA